MKMHTPILTAVEQAAQASLKEIGRELLARARELSPTDSGDSDKTGFAVVDDLTLQVGFRSKVSRLQHENLDYEHPEGGQPKFLEQAVDEINVPRRLAEKTRQKLAKELGGG